MTRRDIASVLDEHPSWAWTDILNDHEIHCYGCGRDLGAVSEDEHPEIQKAQADALQNTHQADAVWAALATSGQVEWGVSWRGATAYESEEEARRGLHLAQMDVPAELVRRVVTPWEVVP